MKDRLEKDCVIKTLKAMENILYEGTTDVDLFSRPFEIEMLKNSVKESRRQPKTGALKQAIEK